MISRTFDLEVCGVLTIEALDEIPEAATALKTAGLAAEDYAGSRFAGHGSIECPLLSGHEAILSAPCLSLHRRSSAPSWSR